MGISLRRICVKKLEQIWQNSFPLRLRKNDNYISISSVIKYNRAVKIEQKLLLLDTTKTISSHSFCDYAEGLKRYVIQVHKRIDYS